MASWTQQLTMEELPDEVLALVLSYLTPRDLLLAIERLNLRFRSLLADEVLWSYLLLTYGGRQLPTGRARGLGNKWEERIRARSGWKALLKAQHLTSKNWQNGNFKSRKTKLVPSGRCYCVLFDEEKDILLNGNTSGEVQHRQLSTNDLKQTWVAHKRGYLYCMEFVPISDGSTRLATGALDQVVRLWDLDTGRELCHLSGHQGSISALCAMPGENRIVSCSVDHSARVWDLQKEECVMVLVPDAEESPLDQAVNCVMPWGHREVLTATNKGELHFFDTGSGKLTAVLHSEVSTILSLLRNPQREHEIFVGGGPLRGKNAREFPVLRYDLRMASAQELVPLQRYVGHPEWVECAAVNGLGQLMTGSGNGHINVFDVESGDCISKGWTKGSRSKPGSNRRITCMQASPMRLVSGSMDGLVRHWDFSPPF